MQVLDSTVVCESVMVLLCGTELGWIVFVCLKITEDKNENSENKNQCLTQLVTFKNKSKAVEQ